MFNSALIYELAVLKHVCRAVAVCNLPRRRRNMMEAKRLLKFLDYFLAIPSEDIPNNSIMQGIYRRKLLSMYNVSLKRRILSCENLQIV